MIYKIRFHPIADKEFSEAYQWYEEKIEGLGDRFILAIDIQLVQISSRPLLYPKKRGNFREAKVKAFPYLVVYKIYEKDKTVFISAVYHTSRNPKKKYRK